MPTIQIDENTKEYISPKNSSNRRHYVLYRLTPDRLVLPTKTGKTISDIMKILDGLLCEDIWIQIEIKEEKSG